MELKCWTQTDGEWLRRVLRPSVVITVNQPILAMSGYKEVHTYKQSQYFAVFGHPWEQSVTLEGYFHCWSSNRRASFCLFSPPPSIELGFLQNASSSKEDSLTKIQVVGCLDPEDGKSRILRHIADRTNRHAVISQMSWIFVNAAVRISRLARQYNFQKRTNVFVTLFLTFFCLVSDWC